MMKDKSEEQIVWEEEVWDNEYDLYTRYFLEGELFVFLRKMMEATIVKTSLEVRNQDKILKWINIK